MNTPRTFLLIVLVVLAGCSGGAPDRQMTTSTATSDEKAHLPMSATTGDARILEKEMNKTAHVDVWASNGRLYVEYSLYSESVSIPNASTTPFSELNKSQTELVLLLWDYSRLVEDDRIDGSLTIMAKWGNKTICLWSVQEDWVRQYERDELTVNELFDKIRETRVNLSEKGYDG